jgi:hypothetical protein
MCDYSLHGVATRPAKVGDKLITIRPAVASLRPVNRTWPYASFPARKWFSSARSSGSLPGFSFFSGGPPRYAIRWPGSGKST